MRTTLDIDDDVLQAAKELAVAHRETAGQVLSDLARGARAETPLRARQGITAPFWPPMHPGWLRCSSLT
jgi:hypothetical protein